jgi:hypothetical protein
MYSSINNEMFGIDGFFYTCPFSGTNYRNFAARVSIYLTNAPAGLGKCTGIEVIPNSSKYVGGVEKPEDKIVLVDFAPANKAVIVAKSTDEERASMDLHIDRAKELCAEMGVPVCDCYAIWKQMAKAGVDTTSLLSNDINHPAREMHYLFAYELVKMIIGGEI